MKRVFAFSVVLTLILAVLGAHVSAAQTVSVDIWTDIKNGGTAVIIPEVNCPMPDRTSMTLDDGQSEAFHIDFSEEGVYAYTIRIEPDDREITFDDTVYRVNVFVTKEGERLYTSIVIYNKKTGGKFSPQGYDEPCTVTFVNDVASVTPDETTATTPSGESGTDSGTTTPTERNSGSDKGDPDDDAKDDRTPSGEDGTDSGAVTPTQQIPGSAKNDPNDGAMDTSNEPDVSSRPQTGDDSRLDFYLLLAIIASAGLFMLSVFYYRSVVKETHKR